MEMHFLGSTPDSEELQERGPALCVLTSLSDAFQVLRTKLDWMPWVSNEVYSYVWTLVWPILCPTAKLTCYLLAQLPSLEFCGLCSSQVTLDIQQMKDRAGVVGMPG